MKTSTEKPTDSKTRKVKPLPVLLAGLTAKDHDKFSIVLENDPHPKSPTYSEEFRVAAAIIFHDSNGLEGQSFHIQDLSIDKIRQLCKNIGVTNVGSASKFQCRRAIAGHIDYLKALEAHGLAPTSQAARVTSTICRAVNVIFSSSYIEEFLKVNDRKVRMDHESRRTFKQFWIRAAFSHNDCVQGGGGDVQEGIGSDLSQSDVEPGDEDDRANLSQKNQVSYRTSTTLASLEEDCDDNTVNNKQVSTRDGNDEFAKLVFPAGDVHLATLEENPDINLMSVDQFSADAFRTKIDALFKIRRAMKDNMTKSGIHDSDPWNFVEASMGKTTTALTKVGVYYFYMRCEMVPGIDAQFVPFLDSSLKGSSCSLGDVSSLDMDSTPSMTSKRLKVEETLGEIANLSKKMMEYIQGMSTKREEHEQMKEEKEEKRLKKEEEKEQSRIQRDNEERRFAHRLELAKALGDTEMLRTLMEEENNK